MRKQGAVAALLFSLLFLGGSVVLADDSPLPPTNLKKVGDHWTPWDPPDPGPDAYIIQKGDTLWDLAEKWLGDPYLWPQVWDENRYILDSHWIYPGDPLVIPGKPTVVSEIPDEGGELPDEEPVEQADSEEPNQGFTPQPAKLAVAPLPAPLIPVADTADLYCSGFIEREHAASELWIAGAGEDSRDGQATGDVIYLNHGTDWGIDAGDEFAIVRVKRDVSHPVTGDDLGVLVRRRGRVRVLLAHATSATAVIEMACEDIRTGDELVPWQEIPAPLMTSRPQFERYDVEPSGGPTGHVVAVIDNLPTVGEGHVIYTDLGVGSGVNPGDLLTIFRDNEALPRIKLGQAVVLTVEPGSSTVKITRSVREIDVGDRVEVDN